MALFGTENKKLPEPRTAQSAELRTFSPSDRVLTEGMCVGEPK
jgi:hypothetical protein